MVSRPSSKTCREAWASVQRAERARRGWTQSRLAEETGVSASSLSRFENAANAPTIVEAVAISQALGFSLSDVEEALYAQID